MATHKTKNGYVKCWWKEAVVYQIYPRSFYDSSGDGIGDLRGIIEKLPHIQGLGANVIWLSPHFDSPNADNGYDIRNYRQIGAEYGTMSDFDDLMAAVKLAGMRLIVDLVVNHTSDEHEWFKTSRGSKDNSKRDYYIWSDHKPNDWTSIFGGPAWTQEAATGCWYLHLFDPRQPDLNWDNPKVRTEVYDIMRFWLDKGVDGFRMDVIPFISKDKSFPDLPADLRSRPQYVYANGPNLHSYLQEMRQEVLSKYDAVTVGEAFGVTLENTSKLIDARRGELDMIFQFAAVEIDRDSQGLWKPWSLPELKSVFTRQDQALSSYCWPTVFLSNHDNPRLVSRFGDDRLEWREKSATLLAVLLLTLKGTPFIYQGDEIGLTNRAFTHISQFNDVWAKTAWRDKVESGQVTPETFLANQNRVSRDHARMPIPWTSEGGFSTGVPWFALNPNFAEVNAQTGREIYEAYATLIALRRQSPELIYGDFCDRLPDHPNVFAYERKLGETGYLIMLNFSNEEQPLHLKNGLGAEACRFSNYADAAGMAQPLRGWESRIYRL